MTTTLTSRFELKYWLHPSLLPAARAAIRPFVRADRHATATPVYPISSLYLDSPDLALYGATVEGRRDRFKLRVRSYSDREDAPVYLEIKRRSGAAIRKTRVAVDRASARRLLVGDRVCDGAIAEAREFDAAMRDVRAVPVMRVRYRREAYEDLHAASVRVTFDTHLSHHSTTGPDLGLDGPGWCETPTAGVILEIKFTGTCPSWAQAMVGALGLEQRSIPKYVMCVDRCREVAGRQPVGAARSTT
jgi:hypothetical protein